VVVGAAGTDAACPWLLLLVPMSGVLVHAGAEPATIAHGAGARVGLSLGRGATTAAVSLRAVHGLALRRIKPS